MPATRTVPKSVQAGSRTGDKAGEYVSLQIDDPTFTQPLRANLFESGSDRSAFHLIWTRPSKRREPQLIRAAIVRHSGICL